MSNSRQDHSNQLGEDKLDMQSPDLVSQNFEKLAELFPNCVTESATGKAIDFDLLKQELNHAVVEGNKERYRLEWPGKREAIVTANLPTTKTLRPVREDSVDFDNTENIYIEGDNLEVLKLLQESYLGKIKMIYIDPPYNTGSDFIYKDNFSKDANAELFESGQRDESSQRLVKNLDSSGKYHSDWLSMMYPRLKLARNLLNDLGIIFISIGDNEYQNLKKLCDEIFGEKNFCAQFIWNTEGNTDNQYEIKVNHEYVLSYYKNIEFSSSAIGCVVDPNTREDSNLWKGYADNNINKNSPENPPSIIELPEGFPSIEEELFYPAKKLDSDFFRVVENDKFISESLKNKYNIESKSGLPIKLDDMEVKEYKLTKPCRIFVGMANKNKLLEFIKNGCKEILDEGNPLSFYINSNAAVRYRKQNDKPRNILSVLKNFGTTEKTKNYLRRMGIFYDYPKPIGLIEYLIRIGCENDGIVLDFFAGSGTTAEAIFNCNRDLKNRRFIIVQYPEKLDPSKKEQKDAYDFCLANNISPNLVEISKERVRRSARKIEEETGSQIDYGFRVYRLDESNMQDVYYRPQDLDQAKMDLFGDNVKPDRTEDDLLAQVMLDWGLPLSLKIEQANVAGKKVFKVAENSLFACFGKGIDEAFAKEIAKEKPLRIVFKDAGFKDDTAKTNVKQLLKQLSPETEMKVL